ncbi:MAG: ABC transporter ATP-binding protein [Chloroflexi bacterium]|nr:ABC transporter ATP-binding protein [Chloroflexota bacterium]
MLFSGLDAEAYDREYGDRALLARVARYFAAEAPRMTIVTVSLALMSLLQASVPLLISQGLGRLGGAGAGGGLRSATVDALIERGIAVFARGSAEPVLAFLVSAVFAVWLAIWLLNYLRRRYTSRAIGGVVLALRQDAFDATVRHDLSFYDRYASGRIVSRISTDTQEFGQTITLVADLVGQLVQLVLLTAVLLTISPRLTLLLVMWAPVVFLMALSFRKLARRVTRDGFRATADVNATIFETVAGISIAKNFRREADIYATFQDVNRLAYGVNLRRGFVLATVFPVLNLLVGFGVALIVQRGAIGAIEGALAVGAWYLFVQSIDAFWFPLMNLSAFWSQFQAGLAAIERIFALVDARSEVTQLAAEPVGRLTGEVRFEDLRFRYAKDGDWILPGLDLWVKPGESVALVGHTGAGKSSIAKLVTRFYEFESGALWVDGLDIRRLDLAAYRRQLGIVPQVPFLFSGSVADNIRYARAEATDAEIEALASRIGDGEWLRALPEGLATDVGERGARLSMGQRQLVALMRVLVQRPAIFILDEATASIDPFTESQIQEALELILAESTSIVIAHRLSTVRAADRIVVLEGGRIIESGDHAGLMAAGGHYAELYQTYFRHQSLDYRVELEPDPAD